MYCCSACSSWTCFFQTCPLLSELRVPLKVTACSRLWVGGKERSDTCFKERCLWKHSSVPKYLIFKLQQPPWDWIRFSSLTLVYRIVSLPFLSLSYLVYRTLLDLHCNIHFSGLVDSGKISMVGGKLQRCGYQSYTTRSNFGKCTRCLAADV